MRRRLWHQITLHLPLQYHDLITGQLALLGFGGFQQEDRVLHCYVQGATWNPQMERRLQDLLARFNKEFPSCDVSYSQATIKEQNWNAQWERSMRIVDVTPRMVIKPSWRKLRKSDRGKVVLRIDPKMSFGTGHHESTRLCLYLLEEYLRPGTRVLDVGCGTGILSIAAAKLGARSARGIDNDDWSVVNAKENVKNNRVGKKVTISMGDVRRLPNVHFDLILSNIDLPTNLRAIRSYGKRLARSGVVILSGLLASDLPEILETLPSAKLVPVELLEENEWVAIALTGSDAPQRS